jgi:hypothetical protein
MLKSIPVFLLVLMALPAGAENPPVKGGCTLGYSQNAHGVSQAEAIERMKNYARLYMKNYVAYRKTERDIRSKSYTYLELKRWTQEEVADFTREQREFMYVTVGGELAAGRATVEQLPNYAAAVEEKILAVEAELDCEDPAEKNSD